MCGRFSLGLARSDVQNLPGYPGTQVREWVDEEAFVPRHNIAPRSYAPVVRRRSITPDSDSADTILHTMKWGLVPHWSKYEDKTLNTTNARSENLIEKGGMWGSIKGRKRCAVVCEGYYEWLKRGKDKLPHFTKHKGGKIMLLAGLYDSVVLQGETNALWSFTIVTTSANKEFDWLHDRQPVILSSQTALDTWLDTSTEVWTSELTELVEPYHNSKSPLECYQVPKEVGKVGTESSTFIQPITQRKDGILAMFSKQKQTQIKAQTIMPTGKRKRSPSQSRIVDLTEEADFSSPRKLAKVEADRNSHEDDICIIDDSSDVKFTKKPFSPMKPRTPKTTQSKLKGKGKSPPAKITSFFSDRN